MNDTDAAALATDIVSTWPLTSSQRIWREELTTWADPEAAHRAYHKLRRHRPGRDMDIATLGIAYRKERGNTTPTEPPTRCTYCAGDGWHDTTYDHDGRTYTGVTPCDHCTPGRGHNRKIHRQITEASAARRPHTDTPAAPPATLLDDTLFDTAEPVTKPAPHHDPDHQPKLEDSTP